MAQTDIRSWKVFRSLDSAFVSNIRMAMVMGTGEAGIMVMRNKDVFSIGCGRLLGIKDASKAEYPVKVDQISGIGIKGICSGMHHVVGVLTEDGQLFTWGKNDFRQLGLDVNVACTHVPTLLPLLNDDLVSQVACGGLHTTALTETGKVYCWGWNEDRQVSKLLTKKVWTPVEALNEHELGTGNVISIACRGTASFALRSNGQLWAWGRNRLTGLEDIIEPTMIPLDFQVTKIACGMQTRQSSTPP